MPPDPAFERLMDPLCQAQLGINSTEAGLPYQKFMRIDRETVMNTKRLILVFGKINMPTPNPTAILRPHPLTYVLLPGLTDPSTALGMDSFNPGSGRDDTRIFMVAKAAHTEIMAPPNATDSDSLTAGRTWVANTVLGWFE